MRRSAFQLSSRQRRRDGRTDERKDIVVTTQPTSSPTSGVDAANAVSPYERPRRRHRVAPEALGAFPAQQAAVRGTEVVQVIQTVNNDVRLVADKATVVRVYLDTAKFSAPTTVTGELAWRRNAGGASFLTAMNQLSIDPAAAPSLQQQRFDLTQSLNFLLPGQAVAPGPLTLRLNRIDALGGQNLALEGQPDKTVTFVAAPPLRVKAIGLRYKSVRTGQIITPQAVHFDYLHSYLRRAYPVATVQWSQTVIDGNHLNPLPLPDKGFDANQSMITNAQLLAVRESEVSAGTDPRTHYFGLVDDEHGYSFMRGSALYDEQTTIFGQVACGPCGAGNGFAGDTDASYADWYGAHELGHTYQRRHPGFPPSQQPRDPLETTFPYPNGFISDPDQRLVGLDIGDRALGVPMRALPGNVYHDVMTYADYQWLSAYTYQAIHDRLIYEDSALAPSVL
jgi:hypothetical protein